MTDEEKAYRGESSVTVDEPGEGKGVLPRVFILSAILAVLAITVLVLWGGRDELRTVKPGYPAPDFTLRDLDHREVSLSDYRGKVVLLNIWSITCPPCIEEVPYLESLHRKMKDNDDFHLLTVVSNRGETEKEVRPFMDEKGLTFHTLIDSRKVVYRRYKLTGWPETFLIDRDGTILEKYIGPREWDSPEFMEKFRRLTEERI